MASPYTRLLRDNADFRRVYIAQLISFGGDWFLTVPLLGLVLELTGSPIATTAVFVAEGLPTFLLSPLTGIVADRFNRKVIMIIADVVRAVLITALALIDGLQSPLPVFVILTLVAIASAFFYPASNGALPNLVAPADLAPANILMGSAWGTMTAIGAALGGAFAAALGRDTAFLIDAASFVISALLVARVVKPLSEVRTSSRPGLVESTRETLAYAKSHPAVAALLTSKAGFGLVAGAIGLFPIISTELFAAGDAGTGILYGARGLGALVGPFLVRSWFGSSDRRLIGTIGYAVAAWGVCYIALSQAPTLAIAAVAVALAHMGGGTQWALSTYGLQRITPDALRGRIFGFDYALVTLSVSISYIVAGVLTEWLGVSKVVAGSGLFGIGFGLIWARVTRRYWETLDQPVFEERGEV